MGFKEEEEGGAFMYVMGLAKRRRCWATERSDRREASFANPISNAAGKSCVWGRRKLE